MPPGEVYGFLGPNGAGKVGRNDVSGVTLPPPRALRSLLTEGWQPGVLLGGLGAIATVGAVSFTLAPLALRGRVSRN